MSDDDALVLAEVEVEVVADESVAAEPAAGVVGLFISGGGCPGNHFDCKVVYVRVFTGGTTVPDICECECRPCKRAWFADGRPFVRDGKIMRTKPYVD